MGRIIKMLLLAATIGACSFFKQDQPSTVQLSKIRGVPAERKTVELTVSRAALTAALENADVVNSVRLVEIYFSGTDPSQYPQYRMFGLQPGSVYELLGLQENDVLVGAQDYVVFSPHQFKTFVKLLPKLNTSNIEIRRKGRPILLQYTITD